MTENENSEDELKENMMSRLYNFKFGQALDLYSDALKEEESIECLKLLERIWGDTGWTRGTPIFGDIIEFLVEYIILNEGWKEEYDGTQKKDVI